MRRSFYACLLVLAVLLCSIATFRTSVCAQQPCPHGCVGFTSSCCLEGTKGWEFFDPPKEHHITATNETFNSMNADSSKTCTTSVPAYVVEYKFDDKSCFCTDTNCKWPCPGLPNPNHATRTTNHPGYGCYSKCDPKG
jgi:hypothetical protein